MCETSVIYFSFPVPGSLMQCYQMLQRAGEKQKKAVELKEEGHLMNSEGRVVKAI